VCDCCAIHLILDAQEITIQLGGTTAAGTLSNDATIKRPAEKNKMYPEASGNHWQP
jgi:hypothetical protein